MNPTRLLILASILTAASSTCLAQTSRPVRPQPNSVFGLCDRYVKPAWQIGVFKWRRMDIDFHPENWNAETTFEDTVAYFDQVLAFSEQHGVCVMPILNLRHFGHRWQPGGQTAEHPDAFTLHRWTNWVHRVVERYKGRVTYWEISNEPDLSTTPQQYAALAKAAYLSAKAADPQCRLGAFATAGVNLPFIEQCLQLGMADYFDFVTVHPYQWSHSFDADLLTGSLAALEQLLDRYGCPRPIWISELGWPTHPQGGCSPQVQARIVAQAYLTLAALGRYKTFWYTLGDWPAEPTDAEGYFGLLDAAGRPKPSFHAYRLASETLSDAIGLGQADLPKGLTGWLYRTSDGRLAIGLWRNTGDPSTATIELPDLRDPEVEKRAIDLSRDILTARDDAVALEIGPDPLILLFHSDRKYNLPAPSALAAPPAKSLPMYLAVPPMPSAFTGGALEIPFSLVNLSETAWTGRVTIASHPSATTELTAQPGQETIGRLSFQVPEDASNGLLRLILRAPGLADLPVELQVTSPLAVELDPVAEPLDCPSIPVNFTLTNVTDHHLTGQLNLDAADDPAIAIDLPPAASTRIERTISQTEFRLTGNLAGRPFAFTQPLDSIRIPHAAKITIDADLTDWQTVAPFHLGRRQQAQPLPNWWTGPNDLSANVKFQWDQTCLYFAADVTDDVHCQRSTGGGTWLGDGFQIALEADGAYGYELCLARTMSGSELYLLRAVQGPTGPVPGALVATRRRNDHTLYEAAIPWSALPSLQPQSGQILKLNFILNESDALTRVGWLECRPGIGSGKSTTTWYPWPLAAP